VDVAVEEIMQHVARTSRLASSKSLNRRSSQIISDSSKTKEILYEDVARSVMLSPILSPLS
jgi:hypothetical protein